jgi:DivIVA domain-containing protein
VLAMMSDKISLTLEDILNKDFKIDARGYRPQEVDRFLDQVMGDYNSFINIIKDYKKELGYLTDENARLKNEIRRLKSSMEVLEKDTNLSNTVNNVDLLKRLSQLEKVVFGKDDEEK